MRVPAKAEEVAGLELSMQRGMAGELERGRASLCPPLPYCQLDKLEPRASTGQLVLLRET